MNYYKIALLKSPLSPLTYQLDDNLEIGQKVLVSLKGRKNLVDGVIIEKVDKPDFKCVTIDKVTTQYYSTTMIEIAKFISLYYVCSLGEALGVYTPFDKTIKYVNNISDIKTDITLSLAQQKGFDFIEKNNISLLFANTGSGKTEIYIKMIEKYLALKKQTILLMPEISLTPQMEKRLEKVFGNKIAIWHSKIQKKKKASIVKSLLEGKIQIIAGARSALFLPLHNLGLIIVDEEHDDSYKSDKKPRFNVKDISIYIGSKYDIKVVLGSATPSLTTFAKIPYVRINETFYKTKKIYTYDESNLSLTNIIIDKIQERLDKKEQTIIFLPTRANFKYQICSDCAKAIECPFCSVALSLHKNNKALMCHYCNYTQPIVEKCPSCKSGILKNYRLGTAELQEQLKKIFPNNIIKTFDKDSITTATKLKKILKEFNDNKIDILIGTQMLSKGHDYHNVTLAVILGIDSILNMTSYKVREKTLSLAMQIAGRSGRNGVGEVLIQTKNKAFFEEFLEKKDYEEFLKEELECRIDLYPPKIRLARIVFSHKNGLKAKEEMEYYANQILKHHKDVQLVGFKECNIFKVANKYRYEIVLRSKNTKKLLEFLHSIKSQIASIDMDTLF